MRPHGPTSFLLTFVLPFSMGNLKLFPKLGVDVQSSISTDAKLPLKKQSLQHCFAYCHYIDDVQMYGAHGNICRDPVCVGYSG
jgi:hypothetical protein